ncbi:MAG TPA: Rrf2 family transcriptional regulator [Coriobacteriia bacterium]|nr:Rrf2 family transcriptional regulator [Coriobacteriia bacterium]
MRLSQRVDYAVRALVLLASQPQGTFVAAGDLAEQLLLPKRFVEQQITALARAALVSCRRGAAGGCTLAAAPDTITVRAIVTALEGEVIDVPRQDRLATTELWRGMADAAADYLESVTLADLVKQQRELDANAVPMYYI